MLLSLELNDKSDHIVTLESSESRLRHELELLQTYFEVFKEEVADRLILMSH